MGEEITAFEYDDTEVATKEESEQKEENVDTSSKNENEDEGTSTEEELDPSEAKARDDGWVPQDEWKGNPEDWVSHREFNIRGELMGRIKSQSAQVRSLMEEQNSLKEAMQVLGEHNKKIAEVEFKRALKSLKKEKREAQETDDYDTVDEIDEQIEDLKSAEKELQEKNKPTKKENTSNQPTPAQKRFIENWYESPSNKWYREDKVLARVADSYIIEYAEDNKGDLEGAIEYMETQMKANYGERIGTIPRKGSATTETDGRNKGKATGKKAAKFTAKDLTDEEKRVGKTFVDQGVFANMQEWADSVAATRDID